MGHEWFVSVACESNILANCESGAIRSSAPHLRNLAGKNQPSSCPAPKSTSALAAFAASNGEPLPCSQPRLCVAFGTQLPADPGEPKIRSTAFNRSRQAATDASTGSWAAALAAARHTWAELRCRLQLSEPFMNQHTHLLAAVVVAEADASPCGPQLALHASAACPVPAATATGPPVPRTDAQFACSRSCAQRAVVLSAVVAGAACFQTGSAAFAPASARNAFSSPVIDRTLRTVSMMETGKRTRRPLQLLRDARELLLSAASTARHVH